MTAILMGIVFILGGLYGITHWFTDLLAFARGLVPVSLVMGGIVAVVAGVSAMNTNHGRKQ